MDNKDNKDTQPIAQPESKDQSSTPQNDTLLINAQKSQEETRVTVESAESWDTKSQPPKQIDAPSVLNPAVSEVSPGRSKILPTSKPLDARPTDVMVHKLTVNDDSPGAVTKLGPPPTPPTPAPPPKMASAPVPTQNQQQSVPNMTPGISNFLHQQDSTSASVAALGTRKPQPDAKGSHTATAAIQNLAQQVRELAPPQSEAPSPPQPSQVDKTAKIIKEKKDRHDSDLATAKAKSAAAAIHTIAFGVKSAVAAIPSKTDSTNSSKDILMQRVMRQKAKKEIEKSSARHMTGYLERDVVDLSKGSDEMENTSETSGSAQGKYRSSTSIPTSFQPTRGQSTRNPQRWEGRGWSNGKQQQHAPKHHHHQQQMHGFQQQGAHRVEAEKAAMLQNHLLQSIQTDQHQKQSHANLGSGWTAREAALIAESNPETIQKILAAQNSSLSADDKKAKKQESHHQQSHHQQQEAYPNLVARQHQPLVGNSKQSRSASMGSSSGRRRGSNSNDPSQNDAAMATLVRKLLGSLPVRGDEPPVVLGPQLIASISNKLKQVINRMVDIQDERSGDKRKRSDREDSDHNNRLKAYAQQQADLVREQQVHLDSVQRQLDEKSAELADQRNEISALNNQRSVEDDPAIQNLLKQLETGMQTAARQKKEITALRAVINQDAADIQQKDDVIGVLRGQLEQNEETIRQVRSEPSARESVTALRQELKHLQDTLEMERRQSETTTRAYMRAAVHALKVQNRALNED